MSRIPSSDIGSWSGQFGSIDLTQILGQFSPYPLEACVVVDGTTVPSEDSAVDESSDDYWGTDEDWESLDREALSGERIDKIVDYLKSTGQASA